MSAIAQLRGDLSSRIAAVRKIISKGRCTHALVSDPVDVEYISGFRSSNAWLLISPERLDLFTDFRYKSVAEEFSKIAADTTGLVYTVTMIDESNFAFLRDSIAPGSVVGFQSDTMTVDRYRDMKRALPSIRFTALSSRITNVSAQKLDCEIDCIKAAVRIGDKALKAVIPFIRMSMTEAELAQALEQACTDLGSEKPSFDTIVLFGERSALPHGRPSSRKLAPGDFILIDFGCVKNGFCSDMTRTFVFGAASDEQRNIYDIVMRAQRKARSAARAGIKAKRLDGAARDIIAESGYGEYFGHATGHGVGLRIHEKPRVNKKNDTALPENVVVTIEPGIYIPNMGGVRIEDMVVIKKEGCEVLTRFPKKFTELPIKG